ncbi:MAG TPA: adenylate/guanylate cyclase domain-containing protein [Candidatus Dormibacteraeota bacterium]|nr:adenylate/guanylate cyclase domain-containing protein [Candidatus Dormibacteraeota bacterium]
MTEGQPADSPAALPWVSPHFGSTVTILFSDIRGFTEYTDQYGDEAAYRMLQVHNNVLIEKLALFRGHVVKTQGDSFMVSFDSARTAVTCAVAIQRQLDKFHSQERGATIQVGIGINVGEPVREGADFFGGTVNLAARICGVAGPGQILVSETVRAVVGKMEGTNFIDHGLHEIKGFQAPQRLFLVDWSEADQEVAPIVVAGAPSVEKKGHPISASTAAEGSSQTAPLLQSLFGAPLVAPPIGAQQRAGRRGQPPLVLIALVVAAVLVISGVVGAIALTRGNGKNGTANQTAKSSKASAIPSAASSPSPLVFVGPVFVDSPSVQLTGDQPKQRGMVTIGNQTYAHGLQYEGGCAGPTQLSVSFAVPSGAHKFSTAFGSDVTHPSGNFTFDVLVDGERVLDRQVPGDSAPLTFDKDVTGKSTVKLSISAPIFYGCALADWGDPQFN